MSIWGILCVVLSVLFLAAMVYGLVHAYKEGKKLEAEQAAKYPDAKELFHFANGTIVPQLGIELADGEALHHLVVAPERFVIDGHASFAVDGLEHFRVVAEQPGVAKQLGAIVLGNAVLGPAGALLGGSIAKKIKPYLQIKGRSTDGDDLEVLLEFKATPLMPPGAYNPVYDFIARCHEAWSLTPEQRGGDPLQFKYVG